MFSLKDNCLPTDLDIEQIEDYLLHLRKKRASEADFMLTVYGLRFLFRCEGLDDLAIRLPSIKRDKELPVSANEVKALLNAPDLLKHRTLIGVLCGCGWRCTGVRFNRLCSPQCSELSMITILTFDRRGPPDGDYLTGIRDKALQNRCAEIPQA